jgi:integrase
LITYDVRIWTIREFKSKAKTVGKPSSTYRVRWIVAGEEFGETFQTKALAESFRSRLVVAQREGVAFDERSGLPEPMARELNSRSWLELATEFVDMKWLRSSGNHRRSIAEALATVTPALLATDRGVPADADIRRALYAWVFNKSRRDAGPPPADLVPVVQWLRNNTVKLSALNDAALVRKALDTLATLLTGKAAAPNTIARRRAVFYGALRYGVELAYLDSHPMDRVSWIAPKNTEEIDRQVVANPMQARKLLAAVASQAPEMQAFFGSMYYAALRPEEALHLVVDEFERPKRKGGWGWFHLTGATVRVGEGWGDESGNMENRALKHRGRNATRDVPVPPVLCDLLDRHIELYPAGPDGRLFVVRRGPRGRYRPSTGRPIPNNTYARVWRDARKATLTDAQQRSVLAKRPYDLRHAAVSLWLNAGVPAPQVAEWAGHSVHVLLKVYAKCIDGQDEAARNRIEVALDMRIRSEQN